MTAVMSVIERNFSNDEAGIIRYSEPYRLSVILPYTPGAKVRLTQATARMNMTQRAIRPGTCQSKLKKSDINP